MVSKQDIDRLRLRTGQLVTEDWFDDLCDVLEEVSVGGAVTPDGIVQKSLIPYEYVSLGNELHHFVIAYIDELNAGEVKADDVFVNRNIDSGTIQTKQINAETGNFSEDLFVKGKRVIKDEDPIFIKEFLSPADYQLYDKSFNAVKAAILELEPVLIEPYITMVKIVEYKTPLPANGTFESGWTDCSGFSVITGTVYSDTDGTLYIQQSGDGTEVDYEEVINVIGGERKGFKYDLLAEYVNVIFVNSATDQNKFRLFVYKKRV